MNREEVAVQLVDVLRTDFRTSTEADALSAELQQALALPFRYHPARLAISISLRDPSPPPALEEVAGKAIKGESLFGHEEHDLALWLGLLIEHSGGQGMTRRLLQDAVAAHWHRGIRQLWVRWTGEAGKDVPTFYASLLDTVD
jgi:hypothetical protein